eukprot:COSAG02_NODE_4614_length_5165_cov_1.697592_7_plen_94_part_01
MAALCCSCYAPFYRSCPLQLKLTKCARWEQLRKKEHAAHGKLKAAFGKVADTLATALKARKEDVISNIGITERARANFAMTEATQSANWAATPQ